VKLHLIKRSRKNHANLFEPFLTLAMRHELTLRKIQKNKFAKHPISSLNFWA